MSLPLCYLAIGAWGIAIPVVAAPGQCNATADADRVVCVYPLSGQYATSARVLFYIVIVFAICMRRCTWIVVGALASAMTYSGTTAVHALLLAIASHSSTMRFDADIIGAWAILSSACAAIEPVLAWSRTLRTSRFRRVFAVWGMILGLGSICSIVAIFHIFPKEQPCQGPSCTPPCQNVPGQILRGPDEMMALPACTVFGTRSILLVPTVFLTGFLALLPQILRCASPTRSTESSSSWRVERPMVRGRTADPRSKEGSHWARRRKQAVAVTRHVPLAQNSLDAERISCPAVEFILFPTLVTLNEVYIISSGGLPSNNPLYSIDQWGAWVAVALLVIAAAINTHYEPQWQEEQAVLAQAPEQRVEILSAAIQYGNALSDEKEDSIAGDTTLSQATTTHIPTPYLEELGPDRPAQVKLAMDSSRWARRDNSRRSLDLEAGPRESEFQRIHILQNRRSIN